MSYSQSLSQVPVPNDVAETREKTVEYRPNLTMEDLDAADALLCISKFPVVFSETKDYLRKHQNAHSLINNDTNSA
jgi:hypothetical protein